GKLVFTGDHHQLGSVGAGGVLELLAADNGAFELAQIHGSPPAGKDRPAPRLRTGDVTVLAEYEDRGRLQGGSVPQAVPLPRSQWASHWPYDRMDRPRR
ncbi:MAG: hypothetical protein JWR58_3937, partial [Pseudonocardia sp.]|nr:hypothetical protein [Pseudonocardia sp.]